MNNHHHTYRPGSLRTCLLSMLLLIFGYGYAQSVAITPTVTGVCAAHDASVTFSLTGAHTGSHIYTLYLADGTLIASQTSPTFTGLNSSNYHLYLYGVDSGYANFFIGSIIDAGAIVTNTTCPLNQGAISLQPSGGTAGYTYVWSTGSTASSISGLAGGRYQVTISDAGGCYLALDTQIYASTNMMAAINNTGTACNPTLTAHDSVAGTAPFTYRWSTGATTASITGLSANTYYMVDITDANGCVAQQYYRTGSNNLSIDSLNGGSVTVVNAGCNGGGGSITVHIRSGQAPYTWHWSGSASTDSIASGLVSGIYSVTVTDANGCTGSRGYYIGNNSQIQIYICGNTHPNCGQNDGILTACAYSGSGTYTYLWSNSATGATINGLAAGTYTVTATDQGGCSVSTTVALTGVADYQVRTTHTPTACDTSLHTGTATAIIQGTGGTPPYSYEWHQDWYTAPLIGTTQTVSNLSLNTYLFVNVTDANGCIPNLAYDSVYIDKDPSCYSHITGSIYSDDNANCRRDAGETAVAGAYVYVSGNNYSYWASPDSTGYYDVQVQPDAYTVTLHFASYGTCIASSCTTGYYDTLRTSGQVSSGNDFAIDPGTQAFDLSVSAGCTRSTPGTTKTYYLYYGNNGLNGSTNAVLTMTHDAGLILSSTSVPYSSYDNVNHIITWNLGTVSAQTSSTIQAVFNVPMSLALGSNLSATIHIDPVTADCQPSNNDTYLTDTVAASYDPNEKEVSPAGNLAASETILNYTVRFQNTGNAPATLVIIRDTLSSNVDPGSVVPGASSHPYKFSLSGKGALAFTFENINLPDSIHDEPGSHGFVTYSVRTKPNLPLGTQVRNTAYIYFDFNSAVVTNTTTNERSDFQTGIRDVNSNGAMTITVSPNPVQDKAIVHVSGATGQLTIDLTDVMGQKVQSTKTNDRDITLDGSSYAPGVYLYTVKDAAGRSLSGKVLITR